jgi:hypothetical protein
MAGGNPYLKPPIGIRAQNLGNGVGMPRAGNCKCCGEWESELNKEGMCNDEKCKRGRMLLRWAKGEVVIYTEVGNNINIMKRK